MEGRSLGQVTQSGNRVVERRPGIDRRARHDRFYSQHRRVATDPSYGDEDVVVLGIPDVAPDPVTRLNAALEGRYAIERELGEGGMATVFLADDLEHNRIENRYP